MKRNTLLCFNMFRKPCCCRKMIRDTSMIKQLKTTFRSPIFWIVAFAVIASPMALSYLLHYIDERHYTNAAIQMINSGDYLTPLQPNGQPRFLKPILSYWMLTTSYHLFGISPFSSRLPFLLCGLALLWVTYKIAQRLSGNKNNALLALLIMASNPLLLLSSSRSIPDIPQALFFAVGALGIAGFLTSPAIRKRDLWLFYLGFAFAFATKGLPALAFGGLSGLFLLLNPWKKVQFRELINIPAIISALVIALFWYIIMYLIHGQEFINSFFADQVGGRISEDHFRIVKNAAFAILSIIGYFIFWLPALFPCKQNLSNFSKQNNGQKAFLILTGIWLAAMFLLATFTVKFYDRYFLPVFPLIAVAFSLLLSQSTNSARKIKRSTTILIIIGIVASTGNAFISFKLNIYLILFFAIVIAILLFAAMLFRQKTKNEFDSITKRHTSIVFLLFGCLSCSIAIFSLPNQSSQIAQYLNTNYPPHTPVYFFGHKKVAAKIRVYSAGNYPIYEQTDTTSIYGFDNKPAIFTSNNLPATQLPSLSDTIASEWQSFPFIEILTSPISKINLSSEKHKNFYIIQK